MFKNITLEVSLKPFKRTDRESIRAKVEEIFDGWAPLIYNRQCVSVMLWTSDGSELLDWSGELDDSFEWCRFVGTANNPSLAPDEPQETSLHQRRQDYMENPPVMTYRILRDIVSTVKEVGRERCPEAEIRVGETFDIGPEFAISDFKYVRHPEVCAAGTAHKRGFIDATATLSGDTRRYAAYPDGIPDGTPFGSFLGRQAELFLRDMGFDYLWLSNGLGFSSQPWDMTGKIYDGERFYPEKLSATCERVMEFWQLFRKECSYPVETRGTNNSVGIDYATDGVPLHEIYNAGLDITAPPNSPWAAINGNYGLELMGHMTRVCELPSEQFPFRYYLHDPWWINSPWYDRYDGSPCDIYMPMSLSRITERGEVESANSFALLSIDNSFGDMPRACINEPLPHILKAEKDAPDAPAPLVWVYPMREYSTARAEEMLRDMYFGDRYISEAINAGVPLSSVVSTDNFLECPEDTFRDSILISPIPTGEGVRDRLGRIASRGVVIYGEGDRLSALDLPPRFATVDIGEPPERLLATLSSFGLDISFIKRDSCAKSPTLSLHRYRGALILSAYNPNTTTRAAIRTPLGAPVFIGMETELSDGRAVISLARGEHREARIFVTGDDSIISCREAPPGNMRYRRAIMLRGLRSATVRLFTEPGCECIVSHAKGAYHTPVRDERFRLMTDSLGNEYLYGEGIDGDICFHIGRNNTKRRDNV